MAEEEKFNCYLYAKNWSWTLQNPTENSSINIVNIPIDLKDEEELRLNWIELYCQKFTNKYTNIRMPGYTIPANQIKSNATVKVTYIEVNGVKYYVDGDSNKSWTITGKKIDLLPHGTYANTETYANVDADPKKFKPSGNTKAIFDGKNKTAKCTINVSGLGTNDTNGITFRHPHTVKFNGKTVTRVFGRANISKVSTGPSSISIDPNIEKKGVWITNLTGKTKNGKTIKADSSAKFNIKVYPDDAEISGVKFKTEANEICSLSKSKVVTVKAKNTTADAISDKVKLSMKGNTSGGTVSKTFNVNFYKKPKVSFSITDIRINIKRVADAKYKVDSYAVGQGTINDISKGETYSALRYTLPSGESTPWYLSAINVPNSSNDILISNYLGIYSDSNNYFKIANESKQHSLTYRYFNPGVQTVDVSDNYNSDVNCTFTFYAIPRDKSQFSYNWLINGTPVDIDEPPIIMPGIENVPVPGNIKYTNAFVESGYCRAIRFNFYKKDGTLLHSEIKHTSDMADGSSLLNGQFLSKNDNLWNKLRQLLGDSYVTEMLTVSADLAFYFTNDENTLYYGCNHIWNAKLWLITKDDLKIQRLFPIVSEIAPATPMMLADVERFGYILPLATTSNADLLGVRFGLEIADHIVTQIDNKSYYSSNKIVSNLVVDVGKFITDNNIYIPQCRVLPYITIFTGKTYEQKLQFNDEWHEPNAIINTQESTMWYRPAAKKGEYATYFDIYRFQQFIDKYKPLNNNNNFSPIIIEKRGDIINTNFWKNIEGKLSVYSKSMQNWASQVTNAIVIWAFPEFNHKKGEYITNNNLYQNYWDLLNMLSGYGRFATHNYIKNSGYTHNDLSVYTYDDITNKRGI